MTPLFKFSLGNLKNINAFKLLAILYIFWGGFWLTAQSKDTPAQNDAFIDSLSRHADTEKLDELMNTDHATYIKVLERNIERASDKKNYKDLTSWSYSLGGAHYKMGDYKKAKATYLEALEFAKLTGDKKYESLVFRGLGNISRGELDYLKSIANYNEAIKIANTIKDKKQKIEIRAKAKMSLGLAYTELDMPEESRACYFETLKEMKKIDDQYAISGILMSIGYSYFQEKKYGKALHYMMKFFNSAPKNSGIMLGEAHKITCQTYIGLKEYKNARYECEKAINLYKDYGLYDRMNENLLGLADINLAENTHLDSTIRMVEKILAESKETASEWSIKSAADILYMAYKKKGNIEAALEMKELYDFYENKHDVNGKSQEAKLNNIRLKLIQEEKKRLETEKRQRSELKNTRNYTIFLVLFFCVAIAAAFLYYFRKYRKNMNERKQLLAQIAQFNRAKQELIDNSTILTTKVSELNVDRINEYSGNKLNETDWKILHALKLEPKSTNREIAEKVHMSYEGVVSSLRKMYKLFGIDVKEHHKLELLVKIYSISSEE